MEQCIANLFSHMSTIADNVEFKMIHGKHLEKNVEILFTN